jgi:DNA-binding HxlR family transcriptional regulator
VQEVKRKLSGQHAVTMACSGEGMGKDATPQAGSEFQQPCPIRDVLDRIGDQWSLLILETLKGNTLRFSELLRGIGDISKQMLSKTLKQLEQDGFIQRTLYPQVPPRVEYQLTELGVSFLVPLHVLVVWAANNHRAICDARLAYASKANATAPDGGM